MIVDQSNCDTSSMSKNGLHAVIQCNVPQSPLMALFGLKSKSMDTSVNGWIPDNFFWI